MTHDEEIIKEATEIYEKNQNAGALVGDLLRIIKSQKSEIEKKDTEIDILIRKKEALRDEISELTAEVERLSNFVSEERCREIAKEMFPPVVAKAKSEAYREFAERIKEKSRTSLNKCGEMKPLIYFEDIDNTLKELTESKNDFEG